jgi:hypothetical protein
MGLQAIWSLGLACLDCYAVVLRTNLQQAFLLSLFVVGDWVSSFTGFFSLYDIIVEPSLFCYHPS